MSRFALKFAAVACLAAASIMAAAEPARATITVSVTISGTGGGTAMVSGLANTSSIDSTDPTFSGFAGATGVTFGVSYSSNPPGAITPGVGQITSGIDVINSGGVARTVTVLVTQDAVYTNPGSTGDVLQLRSVINGPSNPLSIVFDTRLNGIDLANQTPPDDVNGSLLTVNFVRGASYTLAERTIVTLAATGNNASASSSGSSRVSFVSSGAVPEPATLAMVLAGLPLLAIGRLAGRRRQA